MIIVIMVAIAIGYYLSRPATLRIDGNQLRVHTVEKNAFYEYINLDGRIEPATTYVIDSKIAGNVEQVYASSGQTVQRGDTLLRIGNADLELEVMQRESQLIEQLNAQRQTRLLLNQNDFNRREQLVEVNYQLALQTKQYNRDRGLLADGLIAMADYEPSANRYAYFQRRRELLTASLRADSTARERQLRQINSFEDRILTNLIAVRAILDRLYLRAAVDGRLSNFDVNTGQAITSGQRLGEIYGLENPNLTAEVDEYYLDKITAGQPGVIAGRNDSLKIEVTKIYPDVNGGRFRIDARFTNGAVSPGQFVKGQTLRFRLLFGEERASVLLASGPFYGDTGGHWVYRLAKDGADRIPIRLGRSNPNYYEVLEGLSPGDRVIVSTYDGFAEYDHITIN
ncbi:efflux RND transporter periplasmic adaptor subunit [Lewinella sp. 4G2]|uniref:efflux RND transporter periplasmic adaptor subunit n=1 Tax=Lewinella sp. 4G2 TaxID=1803372 RepID=UPI0007B4D6B9|nr:HlyD family efflux transporter periplasmic adaptor subunit [Lewinella sp. 4G2]